MRPHQQPASRVKDGAFSAPAAAEIDHLYIQRDTAWRLTCKACADGLPATVAA